MVEIVRLVDSAAKLRVGLLLAVWLAIPVLVSAAEPSKYSLLWNTNSAPIVVEVSGIDQESLRQLPETNPTADAWRKFLSVYVVQGDFIADMKAPAMLGSYRVEGNVICFQPQFPLERGLAYRAVFRPSKLPGVGDNRAADIISRFQLPEGTQRPTTVVAQVYPTSDVLPENLLKFYIHFSAPMRGGNIYEHIHLRDEAGKLVQLPFLELDEELWDPEMMRLTLFIDPGRIKREVKPLEDIGPALEAGINYTLEIDAAWRDDAGQPLRESFRKSFRVSAADREAMSLTSWKIKPPTVGTRDVLEVRFSEPMDQALALRVIRVANVAGRMIEGSIALSDHETCWNFTPQENWAAGRHLLQVQNIIEDLAGNNIGKAFEVDLFERVGRRFTNQVVSLSFEVR